MEQEKKQALQTSEQNRQTALLKISENELSQTIAAGKFNQAHELLPTKFAEVFEQPKVFEQVMAIGEAAVLRQIEYELIQLSMLVSVGGNLTKAAVPFIARQLVEMFPNESIADFRLCFERGAMCRYGDIQRLDGATIGKWMKGYLEEKFIEHENLWKKEKKALKENENPLMGYDENKKLVPVVDDEDKITGYLNEIREKAANAKIKNVMDLSSQEIRKFGKEKPVEGTPWKPMTEGELRKHELHSQWIRENHDLYTGHRLPTWIDEETFLKQQGVI